MKKRMLFCTIGVIVLLLLAVLTIVSAIAYDNSKKVSFLDEEMGYVIAYQAYQDGEIKEPERFRQDDLETIESINIGYTGYYTTLKDLEKCYNLEWLFIGTPKASGHDYYNILREVPEPESEERILQLQAEIADVLQACNKITLLYIDNPDGVCNLESLEFLSRTQNVKILILNNLQEIDYMPVWQCEGLTSLDLYGCDIENVEGISQLENLTDVMLGNTNISEAGDLLNLPHLEELGLKNTPLAENEEELALLYEAFPDIEIKK